MQSLKTVNSHRPRLLIFFCGWSTDSRIARNLDFEGYDTLAVWDYRSLDLDPSLTAGYAEIVVAAWSFGVAAASHFIATHRHLPITRRVAINGTLKPVDNLRGIPEDIFNGTLNNLSDRTLSKFYRRMVPGQSIPQSAMTIDELADELRSINSMDVPQTEWDFAFISTDDRIIPPENQRTAWAGTPIREIEGSHTPDFKAILSPLLVDKQRVAARFGSAASTYNHAAEAQQIIIDRLLSLAPLDPEITIEIGSGTGLLTERFLKRYTPEKFTLVDLCPTPVEGACAVQADAEQWIAQQPDHSATAIISASAMQWFNSPLRFIEQVKRVLKPGCTALLSTFGPETMRELRPWIAGLPYLSEHELPHAVRSEIITLEFDSAIELLRHIRATGVAATSAGPASALRISRNMRPDSNGKYTLTYQPIYLKIRK